MLRAPHLEQRLRAFCLAAFAAERGAELPFAFEEHPTREGPSLYEYRPLVRGFVDSQAPTLRRLPDARNAVDDLRREPAAAIFAHAHSRLGSTEDDALFRTILLPLLTSVAERCGGFDWQDEAFDAAYADLERTLFGTARTYVALAPVIGLSAGTDAKSFSLLGMRCFGFTPLRLPPDLDFSGMFHGIDERVPVEGLRFGTRVLDGFLRGC